ncbi:uncharacterized protein LOC62_01G001629 [Vanrija pseudolonga]|uniref:Uncharacterized protein n=1 Tax=Vanrija pseudolonga TaxID=143232 RepID=A0AAF0Y5J0_9TREE|nr:hypothetical protein LOC62_01G001629 [Vanrija pseudolonga]
MVGLARAFPQLTTLSQSTSAPADTVPPALIILNSPHIVDGIMQYAATRTTLVSCLRVSKQLHDAAGKVLYHTVRVDRYNLDGFFLGALVGSGFAEESGCHGDACRRFTERDKDKDKDINKTTVENALPTGQGKTRGQKKNAQKRKRKAAGRTTNFKAPLLAHVQVLSLGSHHTCVCHLYGEHVGSLLPNLDTLRIVPAPDTTYKLKPLCDDANTCLIFQNVAPAKLVLRNLDDGDSHFTTWPEGDHWNEGGLLEVVWVVPIDGRRHGNGGLISTAEYFFATAEVKVIFHDDWEVWRLPPGSQVDRIFKAMHLSKAPLTPSDIVYPASHWCMYTDPRNTICGLETVEFVPEHDDLVSTFEHFFPDVHLDSDRLRQLVRDELRTGSLQAAFDQDEYEDNDFPKSIEYKTLEEYAALPELERLYDLDDDLPPWLEMTESKTKVTSSRYIAAEDSNFMYETKINGL